MPTKYKFEQVQEIFKKNGCILKTEAYQNQLGILEYVASCGHTHTVILKEFLNGVGIKCKNCALEIPTYEHVVKKFADKGCVMTMTEEEFIQNYKNNTCKIKYNAFCGHENIVSYKNFTTLNQGINCPKCVHKNTSVKLTELHSENKLSGYKQELNCIQYFTPFLISNAHFNRQKNKKKCKINSRNFTYDGLTFSSSVFILEEVKDEM